MSIPDTLNLQAIPPSQGMDKHPCGMFDFTITNTFLQENKEATGAMLVIEFTTPAGMIVKRYNVINPSPQAVEIANKELSALGHAINIYQVAFPKNPDGSPVMTMAGHTLRGGRGRMEVAYQRGQEPTAEKPSGGYVEVRKVFDAQGNEPGKASASDLAPMQNNGGGWNNNQPQQQPNQPAANPAANAGWSSGPAANPASANPAPAQQGGKPSWAS